ncbi:hypothetical protein [Teichococcus deserti]|nr:hypothetical protein [Pseudoroseomonas deserti]
MTMLLQSLKNLSRGESLAARAARLYREERLRGGAPRLVQCLRLAKEAR